MDERSRQRLTELAELNPGWFDGTGQPPGPAVRDLARRVLTDIERPPSIYPTPSGGLEIVWGLGMFELTISPDGDHTLHIYGEFLNREGDSE